MIFFAVIGLIIVAAGIPLLAMYACGKFVGQQPAHPALKLGVSWIVGLGLLLSLGQTGIPKTAVEWLQLAWMVGSALAGQVALLEALSPKSGKASTG